MVDLYRSWEGMYQQLILSLGTMKASAMPSMNTNKILSRSMHDFLGVSPEKVVDSLLKRLESLIQNVATIAPSFPKQKIGEISFDSHEHHLKNFREIINGKDYSWKVELLSIFKRDVHFHTSTYSDFVPYDAIIKHRAIKVIYDHLNQSIGRNVRDIKEEQFYYQHKLGGNGMSKEEAMAIEKQNLDTAVEFVEDIVIITKYSIANDEPIVEQFNEIINITSNELLSSIEGGK